MQFDSIFVIIIVMFDDYKKIIPELSRRLTLHHSLYSNPCKATLWEEHCAKVTNCVWFWQ